MLVKYYFKSAINLEFVGITYTWDGGLDILGTNCFRELLEANEEKMWQSLAFPEKGILHLLSHSKTRKCWIFRSKIPKYNQAILRKIISWAAHNSAGKLGSSYFRFPYEITNTVETGFF